MLYRNVYLQDNFRLANAGTRTVDVNIQDPITSFWVKFQCTNGATSNKQNSLARNISAIELIDGADVLYSMTGVEAFARAAYTMGKIPRVDVSEGAGSVHAVCIPMLFGTHEGDKVRSFDPTRFTNPQLRFSWNLATVNAVGAAGFAGANLDLSVVAHVMDGAPKPSSFLMHKQVYTWTSAAAGWEYIDLPTDYPYQGMLLHGVLAANPWHWIWDQIRINCDGGKFIAMNQRGWDLEHQLQDLYGRFAYRHEFYCQNANQLQMLLREDEAPSFTVSGLNDITHEYTNAGSGEGNFLAQAGGVNLVADTIFFADVTGYNPYDCVYLPFGDQRDASDWFPATMFKGVKLEVRGGVNAAADSLVITQDRTY